MKIPLSILPSSPGSEHTRGKTAAAVLPLAVGVERKKASSLVIILLRLSQCRDYFKELNFNTTSLKTEEHQLRIL